MDTGCGIFQAPPAQSTWNCFTVEREGKVIWLVTDDHQATCEPDRPGELRHKLCDCIAKASLEYELPPHKQAFIGSVPVSSAVRLILRLRPR